MRYWGYSDTTAPLSLLVLSIVTPGFLMFWQLKPAIAETLISGSPTTSLHLAQALPGSTALAPEVLVEINRVRTNPAAYADWLENLSQYYDGNVLAFPDEDKIRTREGVGALKDAIAALRTLKPLSPITLSAGMSQAAQDHVADTGAQGLVGSVGSDGSSPGDRAKRYGTFQGGFVELLSYGKKTAAAVVLQLIVNDGDPNRGLRAELLNPKAHFVGVACGSHASRGAMCVIESSTQYAEKPGTDPIAQTQPVQASQPQDALPVQPPRPTPPAVTPTPPVSEPVAQASAAIASPSQRKPKAQAVVKPTSAPAMKSLDSLPSYLSAEEQEILTETNRVRANPAAYALELEGLRQYFDGTILKLPGQTPMETEEGIKALDEAIQALRAAKPMSVLSFSKGMSLGAKDHVNDLGPNGQVGHYGSDGSKPDKRINRYGTWKGLTGENISYSPMSNAKWHVMQLVIDDGVKDRGHRKAILKPDYRITGVACGSHAVYTNMCVMEYATEYQERQ